MKTFLLAVAIRSCDAGGGSWLTALFTGWADR